MHWVIQDCFCGEKGYGDLLATLLRFDLPHSVHSMVPNTSDLDPPVFPMDRMVVAFGSYALRRVVRKHGWRPGLYDLAGLCHSDFRQRWGDRMLNRGTETDLSRVPETDEFARGETFFLRPASDEKPFPGRVFTRSEFTEWAKTISAGEEPHSARLTARTAVLIAEPREIQSEARLWLIDGKVVTASSYKLNGILHPGLQIDEDLIRFSEECAAAWSPSRAFCLDVARTTGGLRVVEANTINFAGFYAANVGKIVDGLESLSE